ncbi:late expression factor 9 [Autographa californica multiple nucleopolyhedrovirus]|uniref:Ac-lef9 n=1 Tax=Autographa californica nuclear polyhedrosis virus TaxID=46015 RepID=A0A097PUT9_NPVAC|nr:Ac-lef9 [Autographa californica nucleopolyhedrovirus]AKN58914.1 late expression factor 9 [Autographa californica multiple nucleopolyhedrovirus]ANN45847.1 late expression factor 9 [Autographa californica nucleopolyhedrovirus]ARJ58747.1 late expression factor 9 [synthetic baculovirus AcMNPV-WIV-Syn1]UVY87327.1 Lef-9 baculovirus RNA polymerase subunit [synthetic construct]
MVRKIYFLTLLYFALCVNTRSCTDVIMFSFLDKTPTEFDLILDPHKLQNVAFFTNEEFKVILKNFITDLKKNQKLNYFNSLIDQLINVYTDASVKNTQPDVLAKIIKSTCVIVTDLPSNVFLKKLKTNKFTDTINYLILPHFILWDHNFVIFLNKAFNSKHENNLVDISGALQKIKLTHGVIKDQLQSKNGYAVQYLYSTFLNTASFYANVQCLNGVNEIMPPRSSVKRYYGRDVDNVRAWTTRHPNISQLSTQVSDVHINESSTDWNVKVGLGIFPGANTDCDGDKKIITFLPKPNSLIDSECLLYGDPRFNFICFDKNRLSFVSQQIYYLYKNIDAMEALFKSTPLVYALWQKHKHEQFAQRLEMLLRDFCLIASSNASYLLFKQLTQLIANEEMVCGDEEIFNLGGQFVDMIKSGAKGSQNLIKSTQQYRQTLNTDIETVSSRATTSLNSYISSHNKVKVCGADIYHNTVVLQSVFIKNNYVCYKNDERTIMNICALPSEFLFPEHLLDMFIE